MNDRRFSRFKISERIQDGLQFLESGCLFLLELKEALAPYWFRALVKSKSYYKKMAGKLTGWDFCFGGFSAGLILFSVLVFLSGFCVLFYQGFSWLQSGVWGELPLLKFFNYFFDGTAMHLWFQNPGSWLGLHQIVSWTLENVPISLVLIVNGAVMSTVFGAGILMAACYRFYTLSKP